MYDKQVWKRERPTKKILTQIYVEIASKWSGINDEQFKLNQKIIDTLAESMLINGYDPEKEITIVVAPNEVRVYEGNHRIQAAKKASIKTIPATVFFLRHTEKLEHLFIANLKA